LDRLGFSGVLKPPLFRQSFNTLVVFAVVALSVLVATSTYAQENKDMYFGLGVVQTKSASASNLIRSAQIIRYFGSFRFFRCA
jgi:hypothetical protein